MTFAVYGMASDPEPPGGFILRGPGGTGHGVGITPTTHEGTLDYLARCTCGWLVYADSQDVAHYEGSRHLDEVTE